MKRLIIALSALSALMATPSYAASVHVGVGIGVPARPAYPRYYAPPRVVYAPQPVYYAPPPPPVYYYAPAPVYRPYRAEYRVDYWGGPHRGYWW